MARSRSRRRYPRDLNAVLKALDVRVACPRCGQPGSLRIVAHGYLAVRHGAKSTHTVPSELEANVMAALADRLAETARRILHAVEELKGPTQ